VKQCFFVSDLHGREQRYLKLFKLIGTERPSAVFMGGDLLPPEFKMLLRNSSFPVGDFVNDFLKKHLDDLKEQLGEDYPEIFLILGNDDVRIEERSFIQGEKEGYWQYVHQKKVPFGKFTVYGYTYVPPTPFQLKDWEKYDVGRYIDPNCVPPEYGKRTVPVDENLIRYGNIQKDLEELMGEDNLEQSICLFHSPPYQSKLDRAALDGKTFDFVQLDVHCGSIAIQRFIKSRQPLLTLHGHIHESSRLTGSWVDRVDKTLCFSAAHDGPELALVRFDPNRLDEATREHI
jgi:Icc-related predicted phosphoesterase